MELGLLTSSVTLSLISQLIQISAIKLIMNMLAWLVQYTQTHTHTLTCSHIYNDRLHVSGRLLAGIIDYVVW